MSCCALSPSREPRSTSLLTEVWVTFTAEPRGVRFLPYSPGTDKQVLVSNVDAVPVSFSVCLIFEWCYKNESLQTSS